MCGQLPIGLEALFGANQCGFGLLGGEKGNVSIGSPVAGFTVEKLDEFMFPLLLRAIGLLVCGTIKLSVAFIFTA